MNSVKPTNVSRIEGCYTMKLVQKNDKLWEVEHMERPHISAAPNLSWVLKH